MQDETGRFVLFTRQLSTPRNATGFRIGKDYADMLLATFWGDGVLVRYASPSAALPTAVGLERRDRILKMVCFG